MADELGADDVVMARTFRATPPGMTEREDFVYLVRSKAGVHTLEYLSLKEFLAAQRNMLAVDVGDLHLGVRGRVVWSLTAAVDVRMAVSDGYVHIYWNYGGIEGKIFRIKHLELLQHKEPKDYPWQRVPVPGHHIHDLSAWSDNDLLVCHDAPWALHFDGKEWQKKVMSGSAVRITKQWHESWDLFANLKTMAGQYAAWELPAQATT